MVNIERPVSSQRRVVFLDTAKRVFADRGFECTTMDDIARAAGFTKPILYQCFASKAILYEEIVTRTASQLIDALTQAVEGPASSRTKVERAFRAYFDMVITDPAAFRILFTHGHNGATANDLQLIEHDVVEFLLPFIDDSMEEGPRRHVAAGVLGVAEGVAISWLRRQHVLGWPSVPADESSKLAQHAAALAWGGLRELHRSL